MTERDLHKAVAAYLNTCLPVGTYWTTIPGGDGSRTMAPGYKRGCPDILIVYRGRPIFIELKTAKGRTSMAQINAHTAIRLAGGVADTCRSLEDVQGLLEVTGISMKGRLVA